MDVTEFNPSAHYEGLKTMWAQYDWIAPEISVLPQKGFVALINGNPVAASFCYLSCSGMALLDWIIADKKIEAEVRGKAVAKTIMACKAYAISQKKQVLYTITANTHLQNIYKKIGFKDMEKNATSMAMSLDGSDLKFLGEQ